MPLRPVQSVRELRLTPAREAHAALWWRLRQEARTCRYNVLEPADEAELARRLAAGTADLGDRRAREYRWVLEQHGEPVGMVGLGQPSWVLGEATVSILIAEAHQGQGLGTRAVAALAELAFRETPLDRLVALIAATNTPSIRLVERLGFERAGEYPDHYVLQGRRVAQVRYVLTRETWVGP